jgi:hypothetical protein
MAAQIPRISFDEPMPLINQISLPVIFAACLGGYQVLSTFAVLGYISLLFMALFLWKKKPAFGFLWQFLLRASLLGSGALLLFRREYIYGLAFALAGISQLYGCLHGRGER